MLSENWRLDDTHLGSLIDGIKGSERAHRLPRLQCRVDVWVAAEAYLLSQVIESLLLRLQADLGVTAVAVSGREEGSLVYLDFNWSGDVVAPDQLDHWLDTGLDDVGGTVTLREVLQRHDTTVWSQPDLSRANRGLLRLPLPGAPDKQHTLTRLPARPEFYDAQVDGDESQALGDRADTPLSQLDYVVFDCETTGLEPSQGDEIVSIAAVRIHRGRVMHGESFELLTNPGRDIPALATSFHGIRAEDVADAPPVEEAIRRFHAFAGNAVLVGFNVAFDMRFLKLKQRRCEVLVGFNVAFDMRFLKLKQRRCDVRFDHPTLDALLLSILLHNHTGEHTMEGIAERLGVGVGGRHTALGDSLTTAEIFIRLIDLLPGESIIDLLPGESIHTLDDAITAQERMIEYRRQQRAF
jgi:DNA polymerase-3 subunit epsilon